jgi:hypothetical protein
MNKKLLQSLLPAIIGVVGVIIGAAFGSFATKSSAESAANAQITVAWVPISATQTADAFSTSVARTAQAQLLLNTPTPSPTPVPTKTPASFTVLVYSRLYPFATAYIPVEKGDRIEITVVGENQTWNCGRGDWTGPDGYPEPGYADLVYLQARPCALIGLILSEASEEYFPVGSNTTYEAKTSGMLYLGCNDSKDRFEDNPTNSPLEVNVTVGG